MNKPEAIQAVIDQRLSSRAAAEACGMSKSSFDRLLQANPDYVKAKASGLLPSAPSMTPVNVDDLRTNPAVLAVVNEGMSLRKAIAAHPDSAPNPVTLGRWVAKAFPDFVPGGEGFSRRRSTQELVAPDIEVLAAEVIARAKALNLDPDKLAKWVQERVKEVDKA